MKVKERFVRKEVYGHKGSEIGKKREIKMAEKKGNRREIVSLTDSLCFNVTYKAGNKLG